jgi:PAS domain S-box-containing protein
LDSERAALYNSFFEAATVGAAEGDIETGRIRRVNRRFAQMLGYEPEQLVGLTFVDISHPQDRERSWETFQRALAGEASVYEKRYLCKDGSALWCETALTILREQDGTPKVAVAIMNELTARKRIEHALQFQLDLTRTITDNATSALFMMDSRGHPTFMNAAAERMTGYTLEEIKGAPLHDAVHHHRPDGTPYPMEECPIDRSSASRVPIREHADVFIRKDGTFFDVVCSVAPLEQDGVWIGAVVEVRDVTAQKRAESDRLNTERRFQQLVEQSPLAVQIVASDGHLVSANKAWERLWGVTVEMVQDFNALSDPQLEAQGVTEFFRRAFRGETVELPPTVFVPDRGDFIGQERWVRSVMYPIWKGEEIPEIVLVQDDITERVTAETALRASESRFRALFEASTDAILVVEDNVIDFVNPALVEMFGYSTADELIGQSSGILVAPRYRELVLERSYRRLMGRQEPANYEIVACRKDESEFPVDVRLSSFQTHGAPRQMVILRDLTEQKHTEDELREQTKALELVNEIGAALNRELDLDQLVQKLTEISTELTGAQFGAFFYNVEKPDGGSYMLYSLAGAPRSAFERFPMPRDTQVFHPTFAGTGIIMSDDITKDPRYGQNPPYHGMPEGHLPVRSYLAIPVKSQAGDVIGGLFFGHSDPGVFNQRHADILEGISGQAANAIDNARLYRRLNSVNAELERRVLERTKELEAANQELEGFTYSVSHDLRAPLRAIIASSMIIREDFGEVLPKDAASQLNRQAEAAKRMGVLIDDLLQLSRLGRQEIIRAEIDLSTVAAELVEELRSEGRAKGIDFQINPGLKTIGDVRLLRLVLWNLLDNATKFSPHGGTITFGQEGNVFFVRDEGVGFNMEYARKLFLPFERLHRDDEFPGTGIGLANVQRIIQRHGGRVWAESEPGRGAVFYFTISPEGVSAL